MIAQPGRKVLVLALIGTGLVTWRELKQGNVPPSPHAYVSLGIVYGMDSVMAEFSGDLAVYFGAAWTLMIAVTTVTQLRQLSPIATGAAGAAIGAGTKPQQAPKPTRGPKPAAPAPPARTSTRTRVVRSSRTPAAKLPPRPSPRQRRRLPSQRQPIVRR